MSPGPAPSGYDAFYLAVAPRLRSQLYLLTGDREEARDCVQEALERAWLRWDQVSGLDSPEAWVRTVARRLAVSRWRRVRNATTAWGRRTDDTVDPGGQGGSTTRMAVVAALQQLPVEQRTAVVLHHLCDLDVVTVADETDSTVSAVKSRLSRGRARLAELLEDREVDPGAPVGRATTA